MRIIRSLQPVAIVAVFLTVTVQFGSEAMADPTTHRVEIQRFKFVPEKLDVRPGDTIVWVNLDVVPHTVTARDKSWDSGNMDFEAEWSMTATAAMSGSYYCRYHPSMKGALGMESAQTFRSDTSKLALAALGL